MDGFLKKAAAQVSQSSPCTRLRQALESAFQFTVFRGDLLSPRRLAAISDAIG